MYLVYMDRMLATILFVSLGTIARPSGLIYKLSNLGLTPSGVPYGSISAFTKGDRIVVANEDKGSALHANGVFTNLVPIWKQYYNDVFTNDRNQFAVGREPNFAEYRSSLTAEPVRLEPQLEFSNQIYARGMNEQYIFGGEKDTTDERYTAGYYYEMATGQYHYVENPFEENQRTDVMAMNNNGYMVVNRGSLMPRTDPGFHIFTWIYKDFVKQTMVGQADFSFINSKGQLLGQDIWDYQTTLFFDGIKSELFSNYYEGKYWWAAGLDDAGTMLMHDRKPSSLRSTALRKDGVWYSWHEACPTLSPNMTIRNAYMREDGAVAAIGVQDGKGYLLRFDPVPEPASLVALGSGLALLLRRRTRKSRSQR